MLWILRSNNGGEADVRALDVVKRWLSRKESCTDPNHPDCQKRADEERRDRILREQHEYLARMEDEIAAVMRQRRNGH